MRERVTWLLRLLKESYEELTNYDPLKLSSSTAFFAMFSLIPIIILPLDLLGTVFSQSVMKEEVFNMLQKIFGKEPASYLATILENIQSMQQGPLLTVGIFIFLIFVATTLFHVIRISFNQIMQVKLKPHISFTVNLKHRVLSLIIILVGGLLIAATFLADIIFSFVGDQITIIPGVDAAILRIMNLALSIIIFAVWLAIIYKYLPDVELPWRPVWFGALITTLLFFAGQYILGEVLALGNLNNIYGASASMVLVLLFIFYSSFIFYYGFCMLKTYIQIEDYHMNPTEFSVRYEIKELQE